MPGVKCPECGERVWGRVGDAKLRCPECGEKFRVPDDDGGKDRPRRKKRSAKKSSGGVAVAAAIVSVLVGVALIALVAVLLVRGKAIDGGEGDSAEVSAENYKKVRSAMTIEEVEKILGKGKKSSEQDLLKAFAPTEGPDKGKVRWAAGSLPPDLPMEWRRWDASGITIWVAFLNTRHGPLSAYGVCSDSSGASYNRSTFSNGITGLEKRLEGEYSARIKTAEVRENAKWLRGAKGQGLILGDWQDEECMGMLIQAGGKMRSRDGLRLPEPSLRPTYRFVGDGQLEITLRRPHAEPKATLYDSFVQGDELVLIDLTPNPLGDNKARFFYRMPPKPGSFADLKILQPMIADMTSPDPHKHNGASGKFVRLGKHGLPALRELVRTTAEPFKSHAQRALREAEERAAEDEKD